MTAPAAHLDINADLGESGVSGFPGDAPLFTVITSANIACGGHSGDEETMALCLGEARARQVTVGAHPAYPDRANFGRQTMQMALPDLSTSVYDQLRLLHRVGAETGTPVRYIKPHGALYHDVQRLRLVAETFAAATTAYIRATGSPVALLLSPNGWLTRIAADYGLDVYAEGFLDRGYRPDGTLVPRGTPGDIITDTSEVTDRVIRFVSHHPIRTVDGGYFPLDVASVCIHSDSPDAYQMARLARTALETHGHRAHSFLPAA